MNGAISWLLDWRDPVHWLAAAVSVAMGLLRAHRGAPKRGRLRWLSAHLDREYQHARTVQLLWREEEETASQAEQIEVMEERIEGLLQQLRSASSASSPGAIRRPRQPRRPIDGDSSGSITAFPSRKRE
jgi:hypothetical protein